MSGARERISSGRIRPVAILVVVSLLSGIMAASLLHRRGRDIAWAPDRVPRLGRSTATLAPGLHYLGRLFPSAAYCIETADGLVLIDSVVKPDAPVLRQELAELGLDWKRLRAILITHVHGDHTGGAGFLRAQTGAKIYAGRGDAAVLGEGTPREA